MRNRVARRAAEAFKQQQPVIIARVERFSFRSKLMAALKSRRKYWTCCCKCSSFFGHQPRRDYVVDETRQHVDVIHGEAMNLPDCAKARLVAGAVQRVRMESQGYYR
jgi:hypothetical protein